MLGLQARGTATEQVTFGNGATFSGPPDLTASWVNQANTTSPAWHLTASNGLQTLDATWTGGPSHTGLHGTFHGSLTKVNGANVYQGSFQVTEGSTVVNGTGSFKIDKPNQIEITLQPNGGSATHSVFVRA